VIEKNAEWEGHVCPSVCIVLGVCTKSYVNFTLFHISPIWFLLYIKLKSNFIILL